MNKASILDIAPQHLTVITEALAHRLPNIRVRAFGSRVQGWPFGRGSKPYSDLDLAVWTSGSGVDLPLAELRADFEESALPWRVDVTLARDLPEALRELVATDGVDLPSTAQQVA